MFKSGVIVSVPVSSQFELVHGSKYSQTRRRNWEWLDPFLKVVLFKYAEGRKVLPKMVDMF